MKCFSLLHFILFLSANVSSPIPIRGRLPSNKNTKSLISDFSKAYSETAIRGVEEERKKRTRYLSWQ